MPKYDIEKLRSLPIEAVAERLGLTVNHHKSLCPFHEDRHPSLTYNQRTNTYKCFVDGAHGGPIDLAMKLLNKSFPEACQWLSDEHNIVVEHPKPANLKPLRMRTYPPDTEFLDTLVRYPLLNDEARQFLFTERRYKPEVVKWLGISSISLPQPCWRYGKPFYDAPSLLLPYRDINGKVLNVQSRYLGNDTTKPRFRFPSNSTIHVFNLPILRYLKPGEPLFISEGITDCIALLSAGHKAIAIPSATALKADDMKQLQGVTNWHIYPDNDKPGEAMYQQLLSIANDCGACLTRHALPPDCKDFSDLWLLQCK